MAVEAEDDWEDDDTWRGVPALWLGSGVGVPCITILAHPEPTRIGERAVLSDIREAGHVDISRRDLEFQQPSGTAARGIQDPYVSRTPFRVEWCAQAGGFFLNPCRFPNLYMNGELVVAREAIVTEALVPGVMISLAGRVLLLLQISACGPVIEGEELLGASDAMQRLHRDIAQVATLSGSVLIRGETGTGKELVATALHSQGARAGVPMVSANMATLLPSTASSALFGHVRGAFTGADQPRRGLFRSADGGTLFLDEVGDTPVEVQAMLLRSLETRCVRAVGDERSHPVDVRILSATDGRTNLEHGEGGFRLALWHRLATHTVEVPPLRNRVDDIPRLLVHFLAADLPPSFLTRSSGFTACENASGLGQPVVPGNLEGCFRYFARDRSLATNDWKVIIPQMDDEQFWLIDKDTPVHERPIIEDIVMYFRYNARPITDF